MKQFTYSISILSLLTLSNPSISKEAPQTLTGPYLGQEPPGLTAKLFAPDIVSTSAWGDAAKFSLDMNSLYVSRWRVKNGKTERYAVNFEKVNGRWREIADPERTRLPSFSPDGKTMYIGKHYKTRTSDGWSELKSLGLGFENIRLMSLSASTKNTLVLDEVGTNGNGILRYSRLINGKYEMPKPLSKEINTGTWNAHPFIAPDESYIMWDGERDDGYGSSDLYISFRRQDGTWGEAVNLGDKINTDAEEGGPQVTPDGKYLFFNRMVKMDNNKGSSQSDLFWIDASIIEELRPYESYTPLPEVSNAERKLTFRETPDLVNAYINTTPINREDNIAVGKLGIDGGDKNMIVKLAKEIEAGKQGKFDSLLIAHKNELLFESYYSRGRVNLPHPQASATKAYTTFALGRAIQLGYLSMADLDKPLLNFLPNVDRSKIAAGTEKLTLHKALTMSSGIRLNEEQRKELNKTPAKLKGQKQVQMYLEHSAPITNESQTFKYQFDPLLVMQVIESAVPGSAKNFIKEELLDKLAITEYEWPTDLSGLPSAGSRASMTSRDMLKFGMLATHNGEWNGEQLIPKDFVKKATDRLLLPEDEELHYGGKDTTNQGYGYYWWSMDLQHGNKHYFSRSAQGGWGQFIVLIEELDLIIVTTAHDNDVSYLQLIAERILPAFIK